MFLYTHKQCTHIHLNQRQDIHNYYEQTRLILQVAAVTSSLPLTLSSLPPPLRYIHISKT